ncbi:unnamed protein product [Urochloa humidicola]
MATVGSSDTPTPPVENVNTNSNPSQEAAIEETQGRSRRKTDPAWGYCTQIMEGGRKKIKCMFCDMIFLGGGIHRFKEHLGKYPGNVAACKKVDPEVEHTMLKSIEDWNEKKKKMQQDYVEGHPYGPDAEEDDVVEVSKTNEGPSVRVAAAATSNKGKKRPATTPGVGKYFKPRTGPGDQPTIKSVLQGEAVKEKTDMCVIRWFLDASIPFNATNSIFYQPMIDAIVAFGSGYKGPLCNVMRGRLLAKCVEETKKFVDGFRKVWRETGCTIMADGWTDRKRRTLINFLVYCPKGHEILEDNPPRLNSEELEAFRTKLSELSIQCSDDWELDLDLVEAEAMDESDEVVDVQNLRHQEDAYEYGGMAFEVGGEQPEDEWDPINFY